LVSELIVDILKITTYRGSYRKTQKFYEVECHKVIGSYKKTQKCYEVECHKVISAETISMTML